MNFKTESGRSMTEMLGTLAIIGVLSIGGIAGYSYGMDKYRCNKTMNDISLRTVDLITQASQGRSELSFAEWENEDSIYDFSNPAYSDDGLVMFDIGTTKKLPKSVCQMIFDGLSNTAVQIDINESPATSKDSCGEDNTMTFYFEGGGTGTGDNSAEEKCGGTVCGTCQKCENETCVPVADYEMACTTGGQTGWCVSGSCQPDTTCNCGKGYYCADKNTSCEQPTPGSRCQDAETQFKTVDIDGTTYYISKSGISWWNAISACEALGKDMVNHKIFIQTCNSEEDLGCSSTYTKLNSLGEALNNALNLYGDFEVLSNEMASSCVPYFTDLYDGSSDAYYGRNTDYFHAICK